MHEVMLIQAKSFVIRIGKRCLQHRSSTLYNGKSRKASQNTTHTQYQTMTTITDSAAIRQEWDTDAAVQKNIAWSFYSLINRALLRAWWQAFPWMEDAMSAALCLLTNPLTVFFPLISIIPQLPTAVTSECTRSMVCSVSLSLFYHTSKLNYKTTNPTHTPLFSWLTPWPKWNTRVRFFLVCCVRWKCRGASRDHSIFLKTKQPIAF